MEDTEKAIFVDWEILDEDYDDVGKFGSFAHIEDKGR